MGLMLTLVFVVPSAAAQDGGPEGSASEAAGAAPLEATGPRRAAAVVAAVAPRIPHWDRQRTHCESQHGVCQKLAFCRGTRAAYLTKCLYGENTQQLTSDLIFLCDAMLHSE